MKPRWTQVIDKTLDTGQVILSSESLGLKKAVHSFDCYRTKPMTRDLEEN